MLDPVSLLVLGAEGILIGPMLAGGVLYRQQKYEKAARAFELAARVQPLSIVRASCYINLSACHAELAQPELTLEACNRAERASRSRQVRALAHINRAHAYLLMGQMEESRREAERAIELSPHWRRGVRYAMVNYADAMGRMGHYNEALQTARQALYGGGPADSDAAGAARREIGMLLVQMGRPREAMQEMEQALQSNAARADHRGMVYQIMASAWVALGDADEASRALEEAERLGVPPVNQPVLLQARARVCMLQGQVDHAVSLLRTAELQSQTPLVRTVISTYLASCIVEQRKYSEALERVRQLIDGDCQYRHILAISHLVESRASFERGDIHEGCVALEHLRSFEGMSPVLDTAIAIEHAAGCFWSDRYQAAVEWCAVANEMLRQVEGHPELRTRAALWRGRSLTRLGRAAEARTELESALTAPLTTHRDRGALLHALGETELGTDLQAARARFQEALGEHSDYAEAWFALGQLLTRQGQTEEGATFLRAAHASDPEGVVGRDAKQALDEIQARGSAQDSAEITRPAPATAHSEPPAPSEISDDDHHLRDSAEVGVTG